MLFGCFSLIAKFERGLNPFDVSAFFHTQLILKLKASMIDVRGSQSPNHLWRLCTAPGEDPWKASLSLGRLVSNIVLSQAPRRRTKVR